MSALWHMFRLQRIASGRLAVVVCVDPTGSKRAGSEADMHLTATVRFDESYSQGSGYQPGSNPSTF
jgi:hypothetical protein